MISMDILRVSHLHSLDALEVDLEVDGYVPLQFRTYRDPLGGGYVWERITKEGTRRDRVIA